MYLEKARIMVMQQNTRLPLPTTQHDFKIVLTLFAASTTFSVDAGADVNTVGIRNTASSVKTGVSV